VFRFSIKEISKVIIPKSLFSKLAFVGKINIPHSLLKDIFMRFSGRSEGIKSIHCLYVF
jgi:hypothetical protein